MDLILRGGCVAGGDGARVDVGIAGGRIAAVAPAVEAEAPVLDLDGRLVAPGFVETHIHLDKACILDRCEAESGALAEAIEQVAAAKRAFTEEDVNRRARRVLDKCIAQGTTHLRTHLEVDPGIGMRGFDGVLPLIDEYRWAIDIEICVFPQEGLLNNPGTDDLMVRALERGARVVGAAPYTDSDPHGQIDRVFALARAYDVDIDMHLDFGESADALDVDYVCALTERFGYGGRVTVGHVTKLSAAAPARLARTAERMAAAGVAVTVLPATDLFLMGRGDAANMRRGVTAAHRLLGHGVNCSLSSNNVLNPFTPFGDCSLVRMANLYANVCHVGARSEMRDCFDMITRRSARILGLDDYGVAPGKAADLVVLDARDPAAAVAELAPPLHGFKRGRKTFERAPVRLLRPS